MQNYEQKIFIEFPQRIFSNMHIFLFNKIISDTNMDFVHLHFVQIEISNVWFGPDKPLIIEKQVAKANFQMCYRKC